jgi:SAM-dependent methyltransferase
MALKENVKAFDEDVAENDGYLYTTHPSYSSRVANERLQKAVLDNIATTDHTVLDVGCGDGTSTNDLRVRRAGITISGLDPAERAISRARKLYPEISFFVADVLDANSLPKSRYDLVIFRGVLHHLANPELAIANVAQITSRILIIEPNGNNPVLKQIEKRSEYHVKHEEQSFAPGLLRKWCNNAQFTVVQQRFAGFVPFFFPTALAKMLHFLQPLLERVPIIRRYFSAVVVLVAERR